MRELERVADRFINTGRLHKRCIGKPGLFHLFMAKCSLVTKQLGVENHAILCAESLTL